MGKHKGQKVYYWKDQYFSSAANTVRQDDFKPLQGMLKMNLFTAVKIYRVVKRLKNCFAR